MRYVLDASVALKWVLREADSAIALQLRSDFEQGLHTLIAPDIMPAECGHGLTRAERRRIIAPGDSMIHLADIETGLPELHSTVPLLRRACEISSQMRVGFYDCLYVALAEQERCELVTTDSKLLRALAGYPLVHLSSIGT